MGDLRKEGSIMKAAQGREIPGEEAMWYPSPGFHGNTISTQARRNKHVAGATEGRCRMRPPLTSFKAVMILDLRIAMAHSRATSQKVSMIPEDWTPLLLSI